MPQAALLALSCVFVFCIQSVKACRSDQFQCANGACVYEGWACDGSNDCGDWSDEKDCVCTSEEFKCPNGACKPLRWRCDEDNDCGDMSDEQNCEKSCPIQVRHCSTPFFQFLETTVGGSPQAFIANIKAVPLENNCRPVAESIQCLAALENECSSESVFRMVHFNLIKMEYSYVCIDNLNAIKNNMDCLASMSTLTDLENCKNIFTQSPWFRNCSDEGIAAGIDLLTTCIDQSFTERINKGEDECHEGVSNIVVNFLKKVLKTEHQCYVGHPGRNTHKLQNGLWKKSLQSLLNIKY